MSGWIPAAAAALALWQAAQSLCGFTSHHSSVAPGAGLRAPHWELLHQANENVGAGTQHQAGDHCQTVVCELSACVSWQLEHA